MNTRREPGAPRLILKPQIQKNASIPAGEGVWSSYNGWPIVTWHAPTVHDGFLRKITVIDHLPPDNIGEEVRDREDELEGYKQLAAKEGESLSKVMAGESRINDKKFNFQTPDAVRGKYIRHNPDQRVRTSGEFYTGRDTVWSDAQFPLVNYKFYLSFDTGSPKKKAAADAFITELVERCARDGIVLDTKSFDHDYDSYNLYTSDLIDMTRLAKELYKKYKHTGIFYTAQRYFQCSIDGIDPSHIAWVQEPTGGWNGTSHSVRMGQLGGYIENGLSFEDACHKVGVQPWAPWLVNEARA